MTQTTTPTTPHPAIVALPSRAVNASEWEPTDDGTFYRYFDGKERDTTTDAKGLRGFSVFASGFQFEDGRIDDGTDPAFSSTGPCVYIGQICNDGARMQGDPLTADAARRLADLLAAAADEVDGWATR